MDLPPPASLPPQTLPPTAAGHSHFNSNASSTYSSNGQIFSVRYGSGGLRGIYGYDTLRVSHVAGCSLPRDVGTVPGALSRVGTSQTSPSHGRSDGDAGKYGKTPSALLRTGREISTPPGLLRAVTRPSLTASCARHPGHLVLSLRGLKLGDDEGWGRGGGGRAQ